MSDIINTGAPGTAIAPEQLATILTAVAQALGGQVQGTSATAPAAGTDTQAAAPVAAALAPVPAASAVAPAADPAATGNVQAAAPAAPAAPAATLATGAAAPLPDAATGAVSGSESESLALLKNIDTNVTDLSTRIKSIEKTAIRNGAIAGGVAGGVSGGIVATGVAFIRAHLGL